MDEPMNREAAAFRQRSCHVGETVELRYAAGEREVVVRAQLLEQLEGEGWWRAVDLATDEEFELEESEIS